MFCPHCGTSLPDGTKFCTECGIRLNNPTSTGWQQPTANEPQADGRPSNAYQSGGRRYQEQATDQQHHGQPPQPSPRTTQGTAQEPQGALGTDRDIIDYALLTIVTCGIYGYWYVYRIAQDANVLCANDGDETPGLGIYILLSIVTCGLYSYYWQYKLAERLKANGYRYGMTIDKGGSDVLLWLILGRVVSLVLSATVILAFAGMAISCVGTNIILRNMNSMCEAYNRQHGYMS